MNAPATGITQLALGDPPGAAQSPEPGGAGHPVSRGCRSARRSARFSDLLGGLVGENGRMEEKRKPDNSVTDGLGIGWLLFPSGSANEIVFPKGATPNLEPTPASGDEDGIAPAPMPPDPVGAAGPAVRPVVPQAKLAASIDPGVMESFDRRSGLPPGSTAWPDFASSPRISAASAKQSPSPASAGVPPAAAAEEFNGQVNPEALDENLVSLGFAAIQGSGRPSNAQAGAATADGLVTKVVHPLPNAENQSSGLTTLPTAQDSNRTSPEKSDISPLPAGWFPEPDSNEPQPQIRQPRDSGGERTDRTVSEALPSRSGMNLEAAKIQEWRLGELSTDGSTAVDAARLSPSTPDLAGLRPYFAAPSAASNTAAPAGDSAQHPGTDVPSGLAFSARVVPLPANEVTLAASGDGKPVPASNRANADTSRTPAAPVAHSSSDSKSDSPKKDSSEVTSEPAGTGPRVVSSAAPAAPFEGPALAAEESGRSAPTAPHPRPTAVTEGTSTLAPAREIQLQFHQGEQRVDVRLTERSGELRVAVRTPDAQLAGALRADLPALSIRLEQSGFHAETWHPAISHESARLAGHPSSAASDSSDTPNQSQQGGQRQPEPRQQKLKTPPPAKSQRKEFRWFMSQVP